MLLGKMVPEPVIGHAPGNQDVGVPKMWTSSIWMSWYLLSSDADSSKMFFRFAWGMNMHILTINRMRLSFR